jgi:phosphoribosylamine---glycine ligase
MEARIMAEIVMPTLRGMAAEGSPFKGVLFAGLMIGKAGPRLIEFNVRFGDPECQTLLARLKSDLLPALLGASDGTLDRLTLRWDARSALCVVMAANGYPDTPQKGSEIRGLEAAASVPGAYVFHAGTRQDGEKIVANGGRVLGIVGLGSDAAAAQKTAYAAVDRIDWPGGFCRRDIGWQVVGKQ